MQKIARVCLIGLCSAIAYKGIAFAAAPASASEGSVKMVFGATIIVAIVIALLLFFFARRESSKDIALKRRSSLDWKEYEPSATSGLSGQVSGQISEQIGNLAGSTHEREKIAGAIVNIVNDELKKKTSAIKAELSQRYEEIVEEKKQKLVTVQKDKQQTESVVRSIAEGLVVVDAKGNVLLMNQAAENLLGMEKKKKIGKPLLEDIKEEQLISLVKETSSGQKEIELTSQKSDTKKVLRSSSAVIEDENGRTVGMVSVLSDVTKQKELDRLKADFVSKVTHELRTPIAIIQNSLSVIIEKSDSLTEMQEKFLTIIKRNLERLQRLINDILDLAKLEEKKMVLRLEPASLENIINDICESVGAWAKTKSIEIERVIQKDLPPQIEMDHLRIIQVLNNIVGNAIKFTPRNGKITIDAKLGSKGSEVEVSVADTGVGIDKEDLPKVFNKFQQVGERASTDISGTGLGLSIAKEIVELHHGRIWVESEKGHGTKFIFTLPIKT